MLATRMAVTELVRCLGVSGPLAACLLLRSTFWECRDDELAQARSRMEALAKEHDKQAATIEELRSTCRTRCELSNVSPRSLRMLACSQIGTQPLKRPRQSSTSG